MRWIKGGRGRPFHIENLEQGAFAIRATTRTNGDRRSIAVFTATASADFDIAVFPVVMIDGSSTWSQLAPASIFTGVQANRWTNLRVTGQLDLDANRTAQFGLMAVHAFGGTGTLDQATCNIRARIASRQGFTSPR